MTRIGFPIQPRFLVALVLTCFAFEIHGAAQMQTPTPFVTHTLKPNVYWVEGGGGNSGVIVGANGVIVVDAKTTPAGGKELLDAIAKITPKSVTAVILTHSDGDHVNGLAAFPAGVKVVAHENNKKEQEAAIAKGGRGAPPADHQPNQVVTENRESMTLAGVPVELYHWGPAHTSGDLVVLLPKERVVFTGDIIAANRPEPLIHLEKNGSSEGWIQTAKGVAALDADVFIPGHGAPQSRDEINTRISKAEAKRATIVELIGQGKSLAEIKAAVGDPATTPSGSGPNFPTFTEVVYQETANKK